MREISRKMRNRKKKNYEERAKALSELGFVDYEEYLKSDIWRKTKALWWYKRKANPEFWGRCHVCKSDRLLILHHLNYKLKNIATPNLTSKLPLCRDCHSRIHEFHKRKPFVSISSATKRVRRLSEGKTEKRKKRKPVVVNPVGYKVDRNLKKANKQMFLKDIISQDRKEERAKINALKVKRLQNLTY